MARGDVTVFDAAFEDAIENWAGTDTLKLAILDNTATPAASTATPSLGDFTEVGTAGNYTAGGTSLGTVADFISFSGGTTTFDSSTNPTWAANASNDADAYWGLIYNDTQVGDPAFAFVDLGGPVDMSAGSLTVTWNASGIATIA
jgi:hypothetical protein